MTVTDLAQILLRGETAAAWTLANTTLANREIGIETDTHKFKIGDGTTPWNTLVYQVAPVSGSLSLPLIDNFKLGCTITATAAGTTILTAASNQQQIFTGVTTQTVTLPVVSTLAVGEYYLIFNLSTGVVTVQSSGANTVIAIPAGAAAMVQVALVTGTSAASWNAYLVGFTSATGTGSVMLNNSPAVTDPKITRAINAQTGTAYTTVLADQSKEITMANAAAMALSVPTNASVAYPVGASMRVVNKGAGLLTIASVTPGTTTIVSQGSTSASPTVKAGGTVTLTQVATNVWYVSGDVEKTTGLNAQTGTTFTPSMSDANALVTLNNASAIAVTIPTNASVPYAIGTEIHFLWITGAGQPTISAATPGTTTILSTGATVASPKIAVVNALVTAKKIATDIWVVVGYVA